MTRGRAAGVGPGRRFGAPSPGGARSGWLWLALAVVALGGCGATGKAVSSSSVPGRVVAGAAAGEAAKPALQILKDAAAATGSLRSYHVEGTATGGPLTRFSMTLNVPGVFDLAFGIGTDALEVIEIGRASYLRANATYLRAHVGARAARLGGRWIQLPLSATSTFATAASTFTPPILGRCLLENLGTLRVAGTATVAGQPTVVVEDAGDAPGDQPGKIYVATTGPPYPLRVTATGRQRPGGRVDACNDGTASDVAGTFTLSQLNSAPAVRAPADPLLSGDLQAA